MTAVDTPQPQQNQQENRNNRQTNWILQLIFQLIIARLIYSLFVNSRKNINISNTEILKTFKNYFEPGEKFDIFGVITNDIRIDFETIEKNGKLVYINKNKEYTHTFNSPYESAKIRLRPGKKFYEDINEHLYLTIFIIPHKSYLEKQEPFYKSKFKADINGHCIIKTIPLTKIKKVNKSSSVHLMSSEDDEKILKVKEESEGVEKKFWLPRIDVNLVYDEKNHTLIRNDVYFENFTKHYNEHIYDPYLYLSQFWVLEEHMIPISKLIAPKEESNVKNYKDKQEMLKEVKEVLEQAFLQNENVGLVERNNMLKEIENFPENEALNLWSEYLSMQKEPPLEDHQTFVKDSEKGKQDEVSLVGELVGDVKEGLDLTINYSTCLPAYYMILNNTNTNMSNNIWGIDNSKELDTIKKTLMNTNVYFLTFSFLFIMLHTIFSVFAFKNDIQFWYNNKSMEGLSTITLIINLVSEIIIGLYVYDNENRSFLILFEIGLNILSSLWKLGKAIKVTFVPRYPYFVLVKQSSYIENKTKEYDKTAIKYMSILLAPLIVGYAIYSLYYHKHKSWYSYVISVLAGSVYTFGFIMMTPQLYINYKLKSVEHLPWRALIYKSLNTFVDDVASFLIDMPMLHRLSCFRDDIIFFCYLYQRWKYKVDPNRNNPEFFDENKKDKENMEPLEEKEDKEIESKLKSE